MYSRSNKKQENGFGLDVLWPPAEAGDRETDVDIVFIHGLNGKRHGTWTKDNVLWPRDLLAKDFPKARIMTWGYDSRVMQFFGPVGQGSIHDHANELNNDLRSERIEKHQIFRPLIFFAHSLGGLVVKSALIRSYLAGVSDAPITDHCAAIEKSTAGVIFAGTPHRGSDKAKWASSATKLASIAHKDHSSKMSRSLERGSETLEVLQDWFKKIQNNFHVFTFLEELPCPKIGHIVERDSAVIDCDHEKKRMIHANHMDMVRFDDRSCNEYKKVKDAFQQVHQHLSVNGIRGVMKRPGSSNGNHGRYANMTDVPQPMHGFQQGIPHHQQQTIDLGRVNTITSTNQGGLSPQMSTHRVFGETSPRHSFGRLVNRASTTTLRTVESGASRRSDQSTPSQRTIEQTRSEIIDPRERLQLIEQGKRLVRLRGPNFAQNLITAEVCFKKALDLLSSSADRTESALVQYQLMGVEFEKAFHRDMPPEEKLSHLRIAEQYGWDASYSARQSANDGLLAQAQLYMAIIKGRSAEVNERLGVGAQIIRRQKDDALWEIAIAIGKVKETRPSKLQESTKFAETWTNRLRPPTPPPITIPQATELDASPRSSASFIQPFAELGTSGQLTTGRYLEPEPFSMRY